MYEKKALNTEPRRRRLTTGADDEGEGGGGEGVGDDHGGPVQGRGWRRRRR